MITWVVLSFSISRASQCALIRCFTSGYHTSLLHQLHHHATRQDEKGLSLIGTSPLQGRRQQQRPERSHSQEVCFYLLHLPDKYWGFWASGCFSKVRICSRQLESFCLRKQRFVNVNWMFTTEISPWSYYRTKSYKIYLLIRKCLTIYPLNSRKLRLRVYTEFKA